MARKRNKANSEESFLQQRVRNPPKVRISGRIGNSTVIRGMEVCASLITSAGGSGALVVPLIAGSAIAMNANYTPLQQVAKLYNQFLYQQCSIKYIPSVGMTTSGNVTVCFINNSEVVSYLLESGRTLAEVESIAYGQANAVSHPVWHEFTYSMNLPARRKRFDTNTTGPTATVDTIERDCQGAFIIFVNGAPGSTTITTPRRESALLLEGLSTNFA